MLQNIGVERRFGRGTHSGNRNEPNTRNENVFRIKGMQRC